MYLQILLFLVFTLSACSGHSQLPPAIVICASSDNVCFVREMQSILTVLQNNPRLLHIDDVQPFKIESWTVAAGTQFIKFEQVYKNMRLYNHAFNRITDVQLYSTNTSLFVSMVYENPVEVSTVADYEFKNATFLGVSISSKGKVTFRHQGYKGRFNITSEIVERNGEKYLNITDFNLEYTASRILFNFKSEHPDQDEVINLLMNDNWDLALGDVKSGYEKIYAQCYKNVMETIFSSFPYDAIFLN